MTEPLGFTPIEAKAVDPVMNNDLFKRHYLVGRHIIQVRISSEESNAEPELTAVEFENDADALTAYHALQQVRQLGESLDDQPKV